LQICEEGIKSTKRLTLVVGMKSNGKSPMKTILFTFLLLTEACFGQSTIFLPAGDGSVYNDGNVATAYVAAYASEAPAGFEGDLQFASFNTSPYTSIYLELNLGSWPLQSTPLYVYGYDNASGTLSGADYNAGTYIGQWNVPLNLYFNEEILFDVTAFVQSTQGPFFGFELRLDDGGDYFTSTAYNNGIPPELIAVIPEPETSALIALGIGSWAVVANVSSKKTR
jgi:hypothetical protein